MDNGPPNKTLVQIKGTVKGKKVDLSTYEVAETDIESLKRAVMKVSGIDPNTFVLKARHSNGQLKKVNAVDVVGSLPQTVGNLIELEVVANGK